MRRRTLNLLNSGPSGGKTTLTLQNVAAHLRGEPPIVPGYNFPDGRIAYIQTDRSKELYQPVFEPMGLWEHPGIEVVNMVDDLELHRIAAMDHKNEARGTQMLRDAITERIKGKGCGTLILDLYNDFQTGDLKNVKRTGADSRANLQWAQKLNVAILGILYSFKQTTSNSAKRSQDRAAGSLAVQASANFKFTIIDAEELKQPYCTIDVKPGPGEGSPDSVKLIRGTEAEGDKIGLFRPYIEEQPVAAVDETLEWAGAMRAALGERSKTRQELLLEGFSEQNIKTAYRHGIITRAEWGFYRLASE